MEHYATDLTLSFGFGFYFPLWLFFNFLISCLVSYLSIWIDILDVFCYKIFVLKERERKRGERERERERCLSLPSPSQERILHLSKIVRLA